MISGKKIIEQVDLGNIEIMPYHPGQAGSNSYDLRLGETIVESVSNCLWGGMQVIDTHRPGRSAPVKMQNFEGKNGYLLHPGRVYIGHTVEIVSSNFFAHELMGRSTCGRFGIMPHACAGFGDAGWRGQYVLEIVCLNSCPTIIYPGDRICQIKFDRIEGDIELYHSDYQGQMGIRLAKSLED